MHPKATEPMHALVALDHRIARALSNHPLPPALDAAVRVASVFGLFPVHVAIWSAAAWSVAFARPVVVALGGAVAVRTVSFVIKRITRRQRPYEAVGGVARVGGRPLDSSFPSSHTAQAVYTAIALHVLAAPAAVPFVPPWPALAAVALAVGYARMRLGVHFASDVAVGAGIGAAGAWLAALLA